jgi:hypothetical protein
MSATGKLDEKDPVVTASDILLDTPCQPLTVVAGLFVATRGSPIGLPRS